MEPRSVAAYLNNFVRLGEETAYARVRGYRTARWSYGQVASVAFQCAREFTARGIGKGDRVMLWGENCAEWVAAFFGCALVGAAVVPLDQGSSADFARQVRTQVGAKLLVCSGQHAQYAEGLAWIALEELATAVQGRDAGAYQAAEVGRDDVLQIIFTSGTTAEPKGVVIRHGNVLANIGPLEKEIGKYRRYERWVHPVRFLNLLPLSHVFGQFLGIFLPQLLGGTVVFQEALSPTEVMRTIRRERISVLVAVPRMLESLKEKVERELESAGRAEDFKRRYEKAAGRHFLRRWWMLRDVHRMLGWKFWAFISGGATLDRETEEFWGRLGYAVIQGYGLTETTSLISVNHPFHLGKGSVGKVLAGREVKLGEDGEILVRGGGVADSYWSGQRRTPVATEEGWFGTGDIGALDAEGNLYFKGRKKDVIVTSAGMNVYPEDLEAALNAQPEVDKCVVIGLNHDGNAEACAVLILRKGIGDAAQVVERANRTLAEHQKIRRWVVWPEKDFPRTATQKPKTREIARAVEAGMSRDPAEFASPLRELITRVTGRAPAEMRPETDLDSDLNLSSLERVELMSAIEDRYQTDLSETSFSAVKTAGDVERILRGERVERARYHHPRWTLRWPVSWIRVLAQYGLVLPSAMVLGWPKVEGRERLQGIRGPVLVISNHISHVDVGLVQTALPGRLRRRLATATGGEALEALRSGTPGRGWWGRIYDRVGWALGVALLNLFPLPRPAGFRESFSYAGEAVDRGYSILIFPEGHHTIDGRMRPFREGIALLAKNLRIPVVPMRIDGLFELKQAGKRVARPGRIRVKIGDAVQVAEDADPAETTRWLQKKVEEL